MSTELPPIPPKRYFTIGEVSDLCGVKSYVLRYWEQEFSQLKPMKRRGNRRYYQHHEVLLIRRIRELLHDEGFTISGARNRLSEPGASWQSPAATAPESAPAVPSRPAFTLTAPPGPGKTTPLGWLELRRELLQLSADLDQALASEADPKNG